MLFQKSKYVVLLLHDKVIRFGHCYESLYDMKTYDDKMRHVALLNVLTRQMIYYLILNNLN